MRITRISSMKRQANKYSNKSCSCLSKHWHQSMKEANYCNRLLAMKLNGEIHDYKIQVQFPMYVEGKFICNHYVDFAIYNKDGLQEVHEVKGFATEVWRLKAKLFEAIYPHIDYEVRR